jgi:hypothetical protein
MFLRPRSPQLRPGDRRGAILIVVLALLAIFAVVALTFVFYSGAEADASRIARDREAAGDTGVPDSTDAVNGFLGSLIYPVDDTSTTALQNGFRGHDLARSMYGWNSVVPNQNLIPFNGVGTFHETTVLGYDRAQVVNHTVMNVAGTPVLFDPEWTGTRPPAPTPPGTLLPTPSGSQVYVPKNAGYTYPDANNLYLASINPQTGEVLVPSYYRAWQFRDPSQPAAATGLEPPTVAGGNANNWLIPQGRYLTLRPRPVDQLTPQEITGAGLPYPLPVPPTLTAAQLATLNALVTQKQNSGELLGYPTVNPDGTYTGDLQNLSGGYVYNGTQFVARNDSILVDVGLPPRKWNGKWVKPLVAALVLDLNGRVNLSAHGNVLNGGVHSSYAGYGAWEVSIPRFFDPTLQNPDLMREANGFVMARQNLVPPAVPAALQTRSLPPPAASRGYAYAPGFPATTIPLADYARVNWNAAGGAAVTLPGGASYSTVPSYGAGFINNTSFDAPPSPTQYHPSLFNPAEWPATVPNAANPLRTFQPADVRRLDGRFASDLDYYQQLDIAKLAGPLTPNATLLSGAGSVWTPNTFYVFGQVVFNNGNYYQCVTAAGGTSGTVGPTGTASVINDGSVVWTYRPDRLNAAHRNRLSLTTFGATLDVPGFTLNATPGPQLQLTNRFPTFTGPPAGYTPGGTPSLGPIDLNRPLTPYTTTAGLPLVGNVTAASAGPAALDRQYFARDIFARLCIATGAHTTTPPMVTIITVPTAPNYQPGDVVVNGSVLPGSAPFNGLRYLAQLAANIVDYVDTDDVSTTFVWYNPPNPANPLDPTTIPALIGNGGVVFGMEKPRLVINEAYSEIANDPTELTTETNPPSKAAHVRFWVELLNPTNLEAGSGVLGNGRVQLRSGTFSPYRIQIINNQAGTASQNLQQAGNVNGNPQTAPQAWYDFSSTANGAPVPDVFPNNGNYGAAPTFLNPATGVALVGPAPPTAAAGPQPFEFNPAVGAAPWDKMIQVANLPATLPARPNTAAMEYTLAVPAVADLNGPMFKRNLIVLQRLANPYLPPNDPVNPPGVPAYNPANPANPYITVDYMDWVPSFDAVNRSTTDTTTARKDKTMDPTGYDPDENRFSVGKVQPYAGLASSPYAGTGYPTYSFPTSFVLAQNPTGYDVTTVNNPKHTFGRHNGASAAGPGVNSLRPATPGGPSQNPAETLMSPYGWPVHFDRPLVNQLELLHVTGVKTHELTQNYVSAPAPGGMANLRSDMALAPWLGSKGTAPTIVPGYDPTVNLTNNGLYRAFDLLRVKPWGYGVPLGGKVHGRINVNTVQDPRVLQALFDAPPLLTPGTGNQFDQNYVNNIAWNQWLASRTPGLLNPANAKFYADGTPAGNAPVPGPTVDDIPTLAGADRPFKPFGVSEMPAGGMTATAGSGLQDTILRVNPNPVTTTYGGPQFLPYLWNTTAPATAPLSHSYFQAEPARKILNNVTTVSNTFVVTFTVAYFEVRTDAAGNPVSVAEANGYNRYLLGKEAYKDAPGDLRQQFVAVIDRNNIGQNLANVNVQGPRPFFTSLEAPAQPAPAGTPNSIYIDAVLDPNGNPVVYADGQPTLLQPGMNLVIGSGVEQQVVTIMTPGPTGEGSTFTPPILATIVPVATAPGVFQVYLSSATNPLLRSYPAGTLVSNVRLGNPGPQPGFDVVDPTNQTYRPVVPYWTKIR